MLTAKQLREENIAEYLLYMWQIEDILRACRFDIEVVKHNIIVNYPTDVSTMEAMAQWYADLIEMMRREDVMTKGHIQINKNVLIQLTDLHQMLLKSTNYPEYGAEFYRTLPYIVELRAKSGEEKCGEIETCFNALYATMLMRLQHRDISDDTRLAINQISKFISMLASFFHKDRKHPLFDKEDYE